MTSGRDDASETTGRLRATGAETALSSASSSEGGSDVIVEPEQRDSIVEGSITAPSSRQHSVNDNPQNSLWQQQRTPNSPDQTGNVCVAAEGNSSSGATRDEMIRQSSDAEQDDAANTPAVHPETSLYRLSRHNNDTREEQEDPDHRWETRFGDQQGHDENSENGNDDQDASMGQSDRVSPAFYRDVTGVSDPTIRTQAAKTFPDAYCDKAEEEADEDGDSDNDERDIERQNIDSVYIVDDEEVEGHGDRVFGSDAGNDTDGDRGEDADDDQQGHEESSSPSSEDNEDEDDDTSQSGDDDESESESDDSGPESDESESDASESEDEDSDDSESESENSDESESEDEEISDDDDDDD